MKTYFKLYANCITTTGFKKSCLIDLQKHEIFILSNFDVVIINNLMFNSICSIKHKKVKNWDYIHNMIEFLVSSNFGFYTEYPEKFPQLSNEWIFPGNISNSIIDISLNFNLDVILRIFSQLELLLCKYVQIRFFNVIDNEKLFLLLDKIDNSGSYIQGISLIIPFGRKNDWIGIDKYKRVKEVIFYDCEETKTIVDKDTFSWIQYTSKTINSVKSCGVINLNSFTPNIPTYTESLHHNSCLNRKISIDSEGNIKNCPSMAESFGNIKDTTLAEAIEKPGFKKYWNITKDSITKCKDCEFRYICTDCRAYTTDPDDMYSDPLKCGYDPYTGEWEEWSKNPLKQKAIDFYGMRGMVNNEK